MNKVVLHIIGISCNKFGGLERFLLRLMQETNDRFILVFNNEPKSNDFVKAVNSCGGEIITLNLFGWKFIKNIFGFIKLLLKYRPDIVHFHFGNNAFIYALLAKLFRIKKIIKTEHNCIVDTSNEQVCSKKQIPFSTRILSFNGWGYYLIDNIIFVSNYTRNQFCSVYGNALSDRFQRIYLGVEVCPVLNDLEKQKIRNELHILRDELVVTTTLFADPIKGMDVLIKSIPYVKNKNVKYVVVGMDESSDFTKDMHLLAESLNVEEKLIWVGITDKVYRYLSITDIYVQPSRSEAMSLATIEAMSLHIPVVASNVGGLTEMTTYLFQKEDSEQLASLLSELCSDTQKRKKIGIEMFEKYQNELQIKMGVQKYKQIYEAI